MGIGSLIEREDAVYVGLDIAAFVVTKQLPYPVLHLADVVPEMPEVYTQHTLVSVQKG